ncbi:uncharacterized protein [Leptinotarsa decemlineata]|uniref:uncharacterized protein n=1 Tax=Leptinotarsa decemlineata TaxID=7539 RepID=UPI003D30A987
MKLLLLICLAVVTVVSPALSMSSGEELLRDMRLKMIQRYIQQNHQINQIVDKLETFCPGYREDFIDAINEVQRCTDSIDETEETICSTVRNHFSRCLKPIVNVFEKCLPDKSRELPSFMVDTFISTSNHVCRIDGEHIFELSNPCVQTPSYRMRRCMLKVHLKLEEYSSEVPSKAEICNFIKSLKGCFKSHLSLSCGNPITREAFMDLFETTMKRCDDDKTWTNDIKDVEVIMNGIPNPE